jgi:hypothetical protein
VHNDLEIFGHDEWRFGDIGDHQGFFEDALAFCELFEQLRLSDGGLSSLCIFRLLKQCSFLPSLSFYFRVYFTEFFNFKSFEFRHKQFVVFHRFSEIYFLFFMVNHFFCIWVWLVIWLYYKMAVLRIELKTYYW